MRLLLTFCLLLLLSDTPGALARETDIANQFTLTLAPDKRSVRVEASYLLIGDTLAMFSVMSTPQLPDGQATFIRNLTVKDARGKPAGVQPLGQGDWKLDARDQRVSVRYDVALEHEKYAWPAGIEEVVYSTEDGLFFTAAALLIVPAERMEGDTRLELKLPDGWRATTPWTADGGLHRFRIGSRRELVSNCFFVGTHHSETLRVEGLELRLVLGRRYVGSKALFLATLQPMLAGYGQVFGGPPRASTYLIVINDGASGDGGAFASSYSQFIAGDANEANRVIWGYVMAHELCHFWNGLTLVPAGPDGEWFKDGFADYVTIISLRRAGLIDEPILFKRLENVARRYLIARFFQRLELSIAESGRDKQPNRSLVYGGGSLVAFALDVQLRKATGNRRGLDDLMRLLYERHGKTGKAYSNEDVLRAANEVGGIDFTDFFARYVTGREYLHPEPYLTGAGLRLDSFVEEMYISRRDDASEAQRAIYEGIFGR